MNKLTHKFYMGDAAAVLRSLPEASVDCVVTSPPYWGLRDYGIEGQIGLETTPGEYVDRLVEVFREVWRVLQKQGTFWLNIGDSYADGGKGGGGSYMNERRERGWKRNSNLNGWRSAPLGLKHKDLVGIPWRVAFALQDAGWYLRSDIIWAKSNPMPESVTDRPTRSHEYIFLLAKSERYYYDHKAIREEAKGKNPHDLTGSGYSPPGQTLQKGNRKDKQRGHSRHHAGFYDRWDQMTKDEQMANGRNKRDVWTVATQPFTGAHFATFPPSLIEPCILAGCPPGGTVIDPFGGAGTTALVAAKYVRNSIYIDLNPEYRNMAINRLQPEVDQMSLFADHRIEVAG